MWNAYLGVDADLMTLPPPYARVLSFNKRGMEILSAANRTTRIPVSHSLLKLAEKNEACARFASLEARATDLYSLGLPARPALRLRLYPEDYGKIIWGNF